MRCLRGGSEQLEPWSRIVVGVATEVVDAMRSIDVNRGGRSVTV